MAGDVPRYHCSSCCCWWRDTTLGCPALEAPPPPPEGPPPSRVWFSCVCVWFSGYSAHQWLFIVSIHLNLWFSIDVLVKDRRTFGCSGSPALIYAFLPYANRHPLNEWSAGVILPQIAFQPFSVRVLTWEPFFSYLSNLYDWLDCVSLHFVFFTQLRSHCKFG